jgi:hypothetical protein
MAAGLSCRDNLLINQIKKLKNVFKYVIHVHLYHTRTCMYVNVRSMYVVYFKYDIHLLIFIYIYLL